jgi:hypothetical protein
MNMSESISDDLWAEAIVLTELGVDDRAWPSHSALKVVTSLSEGGLAILGGDVLRLTDGERVEFTYDSWYLNKEAFWLWHDYVMRSAEHARNYILSYCRMNREGDFAFSFTVADSQQYAQLHPDSEAK